MPRQTLPLLWVCYTFFVLSTENEWLPSNDALKIQNRKLSILGDFMTWRARPFTSRATLFGSWARVVRYAACISIQCSTESEPHTWTPFRVCWSRCSRWGPHMNALNRRRRRQRRRWRYRPHLQPSPGVGSFRKTALMCDAVRNTGAPHAKFVKSFVTPEVTGRGEFFYRLMDVFAGDGLVIAYWINMDWIRVRTIAFNLKSCN